MKHIFQLRHTLGCSIYSADTSVAPLNHAGIDLHPQIHRRAMKSKWLFEDARLHCIISSQWLQKLIALKALQCFVKRELLCVTTWYYVWVCVGVCARMRPMCETSWLLSIKSREKKTSRTWQVDKNYSSFTPHTRGYTEGTEMSVLNGCLWCTFSLLLQTALHLFWVLPCHVFPAIITLCQSCVV